MPLSMLQREPRRHMLGLFVDSCFVSFLQVDRGKTAKLVAARAPRSSVAFHHCRRFRQPNRDRKDMRGNNCVKSSFPYAGRMRVSGLSCNTYSLAAPKGAVPLVRSLTVAVRIRCRPRDKLHQDATLAVATTFRSPTRRRHYREAALRVQKLACSRADDQAVDAYVVPSRPMDHRLVYPARSKQTSRVRLRA